MKEPEPKPQPKARKDETVAQKKADEAREASKADIEGKNQKDTKDQTEGKTQKTAESKPDAGQETNTQKDKKEKELQPVQTAARDKDGKAGKEIKANNDRPEVARNSAA